LYRAEASAVIVDDGRMVLRDQPGVGETYTDLLTHNFLEPVNADAPDVEVELIEVRDDIVNPLGVKGVGEIGQVGAAAAIANAVFHATGYRVRELPIAIEHLLGMSSLAPSLATV
jgi:CO/xanthine dehydrogenase Mo-binding subunit